MQEQQQQWERQRQQEPCGDSGARSRPGLIDNTALYVVLLSWLRHTVSHTCSTVQKAQAL
jgi:hypothetical protein